MLNESERCQRVTQVRTHVHFFTGFLCCGKIAKKIKNLLVEKICVTQWTHPIVFFTGTWQSCSIICQWRGIITYVLHNPAPSKHKKRTKTKTKTGGYQLSFDATWQLGSDWSPNTRDIGCPSNWMQQLSSSSSSGRDQLQLSGLGRLRPLLCQRRDFLCFCRCHTIALWSLPAWWLLSDYWWQLCKFSKSNMKCYRTVGFKQW